MYLVLLSAAPLTANLPFFFLYFQRFILFIHKNAALEKFPFLNTLRIVVGRREYIGVTSSIQPLTEPTFFSPTKQQAFVNNNRLWRMTVCDIDLAKKSVSEIGWRSDGSPNLLFSRESWNLSQTFRNVGARAISWESSLAPRKPVENNPSFIILRPFASALTHYEHGIERTPYSSGVQRCSRRISSR